MQIGPARRGGGYLQAAHAVPARLTVAIERGVLGHGFLREAGHRAGAVCLEHDARGVRRGAARGEEGTLLDHDDVGPTQIRKISGGGTANDSRADNDDGRACSHAALNSS